MKRKQTLKSKQKTYSKLALIVSVSLLLIIVAFFLFPNLLAAICPQDALWSASCNGLVLIFYITPASFVIPLVIGVVAISSLKTYLNNTNLKNNTIFTIPWTKHSKPEVKKKPFLIFISILICICIAIPYSISSGFFPFTINSIRCGGLPVESSTFAASYSYRLPGDKGYGIHTFSDYNYCTQDEIKATNGYHRDVNTDAAKEEAAILRSEREEAKKFSAEKVTYQVYIPNLEGYTIDNLRLSDIDSTNHTFYNIKKNGEHIASVREVPKDNSYNICDKNANPKKRYCESIGFDSQGREILRQYANGVKGWTSSSAGTNIGDTGIIITTKADEDAIKILGSMVPYAN